VRLYTRRKAEVQERRFFPERFRRRDVLLADFIRDYLARVEGTLRSYADLQRHGRVWQAALGDRPLRQVVAGDVQRHVAKRLTKLRPASVNREIAFLKRTYNVAIADGLLETNPVRQVKLLQENNARVRYLTDAEEARLRAETGENRLARRGPRTQHGPPPRRALRAPLGRRRLHHQRRDHPAHEGRPHAPRPDERRGPGDPQGAGEPRPAPMSSPVRTAPGPATRTTSSHASSRPPSSAPASRTSAGTISATPLRAGS
jgi:hypothetical protein